LRPRRPGGGHDRRRRARSGHGGEPRSELRPGPDGCRGDRRAARERGEHVSGYAVVNPATGEHVKEYPQISDADLFAAVAKADGTHRNWSAGTSVSERAALIKRVAELHSERREELAEIAVQEMGKPIEQALGEVDFCEAIYSYYADNAEDFLADEPIPLLAGEG